jgi:signal transduction histidine kinase
LADLITQGASRSAVLDAVVAETFGLFSVDFTAMLSYEADGAAYIVAVHHAPGDLAIGERAPHIPEGLALRVFGSGRPTRVDAYAGLSGADVERMHELGITGGAAAPILVDGHLWGVLTAMTRSGPVEADLEYRLADFAEIAATAVAGAQARHEQRGLADEQAALRRVAELAARGTEPRDLFGKLTAEISRLLPGKATAVVRFDSDGTATTEAVSSEPAAQWSAASTGIELAAVVRSTGQLARTEGPPAGGAVPIHVDGALWGMLLATSPEGPLPADIGRRLSPFAELAAIAISAAEARDQLRALADEQAALRRVAELVARGTALGGVFEAVTAETAKLLGSTRVTLRRYDQDGSATTVATYDAEGTAIARAGTELSVPVVVESRVWGTLGTVNGESPLPAGAEERLRQLAGLAAAAIANAENRAHLTASRARVVATADETRRRLQRDVHDGAQQRLVQTVITLKLARNAIARGDDAGDLVGEALYHAERANAELRDLVHGILPASLTRGGLRTGLESLIGDLSIPVDLRLTAPRLPAQTEITVYFVVAEALTNVVKHARASRAEVTVHAEGATLRVEIVDDGIGGADPAGGTGLTGLSDRVQAAEGTMTIVSAAGDGTAVRVALPLAEAPSVAGQAD